MTQKEVELLTATLEQWAREFLESVSQVYSKHYGSTTFVGYTPFEQDICTAIGSSLERLIDDMARYRAEATEDKQTVGPGM